MVGSGTYLHGGGVVGVRVRNGTAKIGTLDGNIFRDIGITVGSTIHGGGVIGIYGDGSAYGITIGGLEDDTFDTITVTAGDHIHGGLVGIAANPGLLSAHLDSVSGSTFTNNRITSENGYIYGGLIYARSMGEIVNSAFTGNTFRADSGANRVYGAVTLSTAHGPAATPVDLTVGAKDGKQTVFADNIAYDSRSPDGRQAESIYLGTLNAMTAFGNTADAVLTLDAGAGSLVELRDPIRVEQNTGRNFTMNVLGNGGDFRWGGANSIGVADLNGGSGTITLQPGSRTTLLASDYDRLGNPVSFRLTDPHGTLRFDLRSGANLFLDLGDPANPGIDTLASSVSAQTITLEAGARIDLAPGSFLTNASLLVPGTVFLSLEAPNLTVGDITLGTGTFSAGVNDYVYTLDYDISNFQLQIVLKGLDAPVYNCERGGCDTTTALNVLPADSPFPEMAQDHLRDFFQNRDKETPERQLWVDTSFSRTRLRDGSRLGFSYRIETPAVLAGTDLFATENTLVGLAAGSSHPQYRSDHTKLDAEENTFMAYGAVALSNDFQLSGEIAASRIAYRHDRTVKDEAHKAGYRGRNVFASLEVARPVALENGWVVRPFVSQDYLRQKVDGYTEKGAGEFALTAKGQRRELWASRLGVGIDWQGKAQAPGWRFSGGGEVYGQTLSGELSADTKVHFRKDSQSIYPSLSERLPRHSLGLGLKAGWALRDRMNIRLNYDLRASKRETTQEGSSIKMEWNW